MNDEVALLAEIVPAVVNVSIKPEDFGSVFGYIPRKRLISLLLFVVVLAGVIATVNQMWLTHAIHQVLLIGVNISGRAASRVDRAVIEDQWFLIFLIIGFIYVTYYRGYRSGQRRAVRRARLARGDKPMEVQITLDPDGLHTSGALSVSHYPWAHVSNIVETKLVFGFEILGTALIIAPKRDLNASFTEAVARARTALMLRNKARAVSR